MAIEIGKNVRFVQPVIEGVIVDTEYDKDAKQIKHLLEYEDPADGESKARWFTESQLEEI